MAGPTARTADVIVVGLGSMGSAAAATLADRGLSVLGLEAFGPAHDRGSMHGGTRIIRQAYFEGAEYVPLLRSSYDGWHRLAERSGRDVITLCGGLHLGDPDGGVFTGARAAAELHRVEHEILDAAEIHRRFPAMRPAEHVVAVYEPGAGFVRPEETVLAHLDLAGRAGADLRFDEPVRSWSVTPGGGVEVATDAGTYGADRLVLAPGAWAASLTGIALSVERQVVYWIAPDVATGPPAAAYARQPVFIDDTGGHGEFYGFPMVDGPDGGIKMAFYRQNQGTTTPETVDRDVHPDEIAAAIARGRRLFPHLGDHLVRASTCLYAATGDEAFVIGALPDSPQVVVAAGFSGHGFKFVPVVGEIVADLAQTGRTGHDISLFSLTR